MDHVLNSALVAGVLFGAILVAIEIGYRLGLRQRQANKELGVIDGAIFALLGLLIAFTFSGAAERFEQRRALIVTEANAIGTAYLRLNLVAGAQRIELQDRFRRYLDARLAAYRALPDVEMAMKEIAVANGMQQEIWDTAIAATEEAQSARMLLLPAINDMIDITTTRLMATRRHPPPAIFGLLFALSLVSALLAGRAMASSAGRSLLHTFLYAFVMAGAVYVIVDMEYPRFGLIRVDSFDSVLVDVRKSMK
jgi:hypothetical protein